MKTNNENALNAYMCAISDIQSQLHKLDELIDNHMNISPEDVNWGHVGDAQHISELLHEVINFAFKQGE